VWTPVGEVWESEGKGIVVWPEVGGGERERVIERGFVTRAHSNAVLSKLNAVMISSIEPSHVWDD